MVEAKAGRLETGAGIWRDLYSTLKVSSGGTKLLMTFKPGQRKASSAVWIDFPDS